jgi:phage/plasmid-associated DNA primase
METFLDTNNIRYAPIYIQSYRNAQGELKKKCYFEHSGPEGKYQCHPQISREKEKQDIKEGKLSIEERWNANFNSLQSFKNNKQVWLDDAKNKGAKVCYYRDTTIIPEIDIDNWDEIENAEEVKQFIKEHVQSVSVSKKLPHIPIIINNMPPHIQEKHLVPFKGGELLKGQGSFVPIDNIINADKSIAQMEWKDFCKMFNIKEKETKPVLNRIESNDSRSKTDIRPTPTTINNTKTLNKLSKNALKKFIEALPNEVAREYNSWFSMVTSIKGWNDNEIGLEMAHLFSKKCFEKYVPFDMEEQWHNRHPKVKISPFENFMGTFTNIAKEHDLMYIFPASAVKEDTLTHYSMAIMSLETNIVKRYKYCKTSNFWYYCHHITNRWEVQNYPIYLYQQLPLIFPNIIGFQDTKVVKLVAEQLKPHVAEQDMTSILNANPFLHAYNNGVIDLSRDNKNVKYENGKIVGFRRIEPEDYITFTTGYDFEEETGEIYVKETEDITAFFDNLYSLNAEDEQGNHIRDYVLSVCASTLAGRPYKHDQFFIFTNESGSNGKSVMQDLLLSTHGEYAYVLNASALTKKKIGANEHSQLGQLKNKKLVMSSEIDEKERLQNDVMKRVSGDSFITERGFMQNNASFPVNFTLFIMANKMPRPSTENDNALLRRIRTISHPFEFREETYIQKKLEVAKILLDCGDYKQDAYDAEVRKYKPVNGDFKDNFSKVRYAQAFNRLLLIRYLTQVKVKDITIPAKIKQDAENYLQQNDIKEFIEEHYKKEQKGKITKTALYDHYQKCNYQFYKFTEFNRLVAEQIGAEFVYQKRLTEGYCFRLKRITKDPDPKWAHYNTAIPEAKDIHDAL